MKKLSKFLLVVVLALGLAFTGLLVACNDNSEENNGTETKITDGRWHWAAENFEVSLKLKEDGTFYMSVFMAGNDTAGTWELKDQQKTYYKIEQGSTPAEGDDQTQYTAEQTLVLTSYSGTVYEAAYADDTLWQCAFPGMGSRTLTHDKDYEWKTEDEVSIRILSVTMPKDANRNLVLYHDGTLADQVNDYIEGTWTQTSTGYDLKDEDGEKYAAVTQVADGKCTYTPVNGTAVELYTTAWEADYTLSGSAQATMKGETEAEAVTVTLSLWQDNSADVVVMDFSYQSHTVLSGSYEKNSDSSMTVTFGETEVAITAPDAQGEISATFNVPAGDIFADAFSATVKGVSDTFIYAGTATEKEGFGGDFGIQLTDDGAVQLIAMLDGTYTIVGAAGSGPVEMPVTFATGTYDDEYVFTYTDADNVVQTAVPELDTSNQLVIKFNNVALSGASFPVTLKADVTITLGNTWDFLAAGDFTTTKTAASCDQSSFVNVTDVFLFMKDGKFEVAYAFTQGGDAAVSSALIGTYTLNTNGEVAFTVDDDVFTTNEGAVTFNYSQSPIPTMTFNFTFSFTVENKTVSYADSNGDVPYQTETGAVSISGARLDIRDDTFALYISAMGQTIKIAEGTTTTANDVMTFTFASTAIVGDMTFAGTWSATSFEVQDGSVTFIGNNCTLAGGNVQLGTVTFVFDIVA